MTRRALLSVSDKTGIVEFARALQKLGYFILSTGGTSQLLRNHAIALTEVSDYTGFPEIMDGRVKSLHPKIYGGILRRAQDQDTLLKHNIENIDLVVVNLYPFQQVIQNPRHDFTTAIENIDIGGPCLLRAAAKNHAYVTVLCDPEDYTSVLQQLVQGEVSLTTRLQLAQKAFAHTAFYDSLIANYLSKQVETPRFPQRLTFAFEKKQDLRYGENPHQQAAFYSSPEAIYSPSLATAQQILGKELSYNNLLDANTALRCVQAFNKSSCVIVKHANPCGVASGTNLLEAYQRAYASDPTSAFGGIIALNQTLDEILAKAIAEQQFVEVILAPQITPAALACFKNKPNVRLLCYGDNPFHTTSLELHSISGGLLTQTPDSHNEEISNFEIATQRKPTANEQADGEFAWRVVKHVKSNAIVLAKGQQTIGIGAGQTSRVDSVCIAIQKAQEFGFSLNGAVLASDAFFPFADSIEMAAQAGITTLIQPGGSKRDAEVIAAANAANIAMLFTHTRHFRH